MAEHLGLLGNPSSLHASGRAARRVVEESRETVAAALGARPSEVVFTSGGTEADNLAVKGLYWARRRSEPQRCRILASAVEHHAVLDTVRWLADHDGARVTWLPVDGTGRVDPATVAEELDRSPDDVSLVTVMLANNEVGTVQPVREIAARAHAHGVPVHTDAVQALGQLEVDFAGLDVDALTISGHKCGGPLGIGALLVRRELELAPLLHGGGQERDIRSGTLDTPAIAGLAAACVAGTKDLATRAAGMRALRERLIDRVAVAVPGAELNGADRSDPSERLPGLAHFTFPGCEGDSLLLLLDAQGIECATGSACSAGVAEPSHVLLAMGRDGDRARGSLRFSLGHTSTGAEVDALGAALGPIVERARAAGLANGTANATATSKAAATGGTA